LLVFDTRNSGKQAAAKYVLSLR